MSDTKSPSWWPHLRPDEAERLTFIDAQAAEFADEKRKIVRRAKKRQQRAKEPAQ